MDKYILHSICMEILKAKYDLASLPIQVIYENYSKILKELKEAHSKNASVKVWK